VASLVAATLVALCTSWMAQTHPTLVRKDGTLELQKRCQNWCLYYQLKKSLQRQKKCGMTNKMKILYIYIYNPENWSEASNQNHNSKMAFWLPMSNPQKLLRTSRPSRRRPVDHRGNDHAESVVDLGRSSGGCICAVQQESLPSNKIPEMGMGQNQ